MARKRAFGIVNVSGIGLGQTEILPVTSWTDATTYITQLQQKLVAAGYKVTVDGKFGTDTRTKLYELVRKFDPTANINVENIIDSLKVSATTASKMMSSILWQAQHGYTGPGTKTDTKTAEPIPEAVPLTTGPASVMQAMLAKLSQPWVWATAGIFGAALAVYLATKGTKAPTAGPVSGLRVRRARTRLGRAAKKCSAAIRRGSRKSFRVCMKEELGGRPKARRRKSKRSRKGRRR